MVALEGGYDLVKAVARLVGEYHITYWNEIVRLCSQMQLANVRYSFQDKIGRAHV